MVGSPRQGEIWWAEAEDKRRPVLVVTRSQAVPVLGALVVAPITRSVRAIPTHLRLGEADGISVECSASFDNLGPMPRGLLVERIGALAGGRRFELCRALRAIADC